MNETSADFGSRTAYTQADFDNNVLSKVAASDGLLMANVGQPSIDVAYRGMLEGSTLDSAGVVTSSVFATASTQAVTGTAKKGGGVTYHLPLPASFTMTVRAGEVWKLELITNEAFGVAPDVEVYWTPEGASGAPAAGTTGGGMRAAMQRLRDDLASGRLQANMLAATQRTIDERVNDFARVFGDATGMHSGQDERGRIVHELQKIVCRAMPPGQVADNRVNDADVASLIATLGQVSGRTFDSAQQGLLDAGVRALVSINDNALNRGDLVLIKTNVGQFIDSAEQALALHFDANQRRLLTRAVLRLVGDGSLG